MYVMEMEWESVDWIGAAQNRGKLSFVGSSTKL